MSRGVGLISTGSSKDSSTLTRGDIESPSVADVQQKIRSRLDRRQASYGKRRVSWTKDEITELPMPVEEQGQYRGRHDFGGDYAHGTSTLRP